MAHVEVEIPQEVLDQIADILIPISEELRQSNPEVDLDHIHYKIENILQVLSRFHEHANLRNAPEIFEKLEKALQFLENNPVALNGFRCVSIQTGRRGRPSFTIPKEQLEYLLEFNFTIREISRLLSVNVRTIRRRMKSYGLSVHQTYSDITDEDLRRLVSDFLVNSPNAGYRITSGFLRSKGLRLQQNRIREALRVVDPIGTVLHGLEVTTIPRRPYSVPAPLSLWHIDGNHKLTRWRIVIHGGIDGFSRKIMYLAAMDNNRASTVLTCFLQAVQRFGLPQRVRSDKGMENIDVARFMLEHPERGAERRCFITGRSVHNQRIERLWRDVWCSVVGNYYTVFRHLEEVGALDSLQEAHLICLHYVMIPRINMHLDMFMRSWERHPLSSEGNRSPEQLWIAGQLLNQTPDDAQIDTEHFGIDWEGPVGAADPEPGITVPEAPPALKDVIEAKLRETIDPLKQSNSFGMEVYIEALRQAQAVL